MNLKNKVCVITGAARGIGEGIARKFAEAEAKGVVIVDLQYETAKKTAENISREYPNTKAIPIAMDVSQEESVKKGFAEILDVFGGIDCVVNNAGIQIISPFENFVFADWKKLIDIHVHGSFLVSRACMQVMKESGKGGSIIFMGSVHSVEASPKKSAYIAAKHALMGMTRALAKEGAPYNIRSNLIGPGFVKTVLVEKQIPEQAKALGISEEEVVKKIMLGNTVDGEFSTIEDVANVALFFAGFPTNALTGQSLLVSHGWHMQ